MPGLQCQWCGEWATWQEDVNRYDGYFYHVYCNELRLEKMAEVAVMFADGGHAMTTQSGTEVYCDHCNTIIGSREGYLIFGPTLADPRRRVVHEEPCARQILDEAERKLRQAL